MEYTAFVFARGGSKGLPDKNLRSLGGKSLIAWSIETALAVGRISRVIVSTDNERIAEEARRYGAQTPFLRPAELAQDDSPEWLAWQHALTYLQRSEGSIPSALVSIPATAPLRSATDIDRCLDEYESHHPDAVITVTPAARTPWFNMVRRDDAGWVHRLIPTEDGPSRRQDSPQAFDMTTVAYVVKSAFVMDAGSLFQGRLRCVTVPRHRALDIDLPIDFAIAEFLLSRRSELDMTDDQLH